MLLLYRGNKASRVISLSKRLFKKCINVFIGEMFPGEKIGCKYRYSLLEKDVSSSKLIKVKSNTVKVTVKIMFPSNIGLRILFQNAFPPLSQTGL